MELIKNVAYIIISVAGLIWLIVFIMMSWYRYQEEEIHKEQEREADIVKRQSIAMPFIERQLKVIDEKTQPKLDKLERKKRFLKDIMPFLPK